MPHVQKIACLGFSINFGALFIRPRFDLWLDGFLKKKKTKKKQ